MRGYKFCLLKAYFDKGYAITSYFKYAIAVFGVASLNVKLTMIIFLFYGFFCFFLGWAWYKYGYAIAEQEVFNDYNLFVKQMRKKEKFK